MSMTIYLYHWKIKSGKEEQFEENWALVTQAIRDQCGSYGSRLHLTKSGEYIAYAQWPDPHARERCELDSSISQSHRRMIDAIEQFFPTEELTVKSDFLISPKVSST